MIASTFVSPSYQPSNKKPSFSATGNTKPLTAVNLSGANSTPPSTSNETVYTLPHLAFNVISSNALMNSTLMSLALYQPKNSKSSLSALSGNLTFSALSK